MKTHGQPSRSGGFSLMEIIVAVSILSILAAAIAIRAGGMIDKGNSTKVVNLVSTLKTACAAYHADVGSYAYEYSGAAASSRKLSGTQTTAGWSGPYLEGPLTHAQNPFGGSMHMYNRVTAGSRITGFDVDGDGTEEVTGYANMLWLSNIEEASAEKIDGAIDRGVPGDWEDTGRVRYTSGSRHLHLLVYY